MIALIWWRIKPTDEAVEEFKAWWRVQADIRDRSGLVSEFLSHPIPADHLDYNSDDLRAPTDEYRAFVNVGVWRDLDAFDSEVGRYIDDNKPLERFEAQQRSRTLLSAEPTI